MKTMMKLITFAVLLTILLPAIHGDAYGIYVADSTDMSSFIFAFSADPSILQINDPYQHYYDNALDIDNSPNFPRSQYIPGFTINGLDYEYETDVETQGRAKVHAFVTEDELEPDIVTALRTAALNYPGVVIIDEATGNYNCHSYAWYMESTVNPYWIPEAEAYGNDVHSVWRAENETPQPGDICVYMVDGMIKHSAVVDRIEGGTIICRSKWGQSVLCEHPSNVVPTGYWQPGVGPDCRFIKITPHEWNYESTGTNQHTRTCTICGYEVTESCDLQYTNITNTRHSVSCTECGYYVNSQLCALTYTSRGNKTHTASCSQCNNTYTGNCSITYSYLSANQHRGSCNKCNYTHTASCYYMTTYCGNSTLGDVHRTQCQTCGHISGSATTACSLIYKSNGNNTHSYQCTQCGYVKSGPTACLFKSDNTCKFCGAMKNSAVINDLEQEETA